MPASPPGRTGRHAPLRASRERGPRPRVLLRGASARSPSEDVHHLPPLFTEEPPSARLELPGPRRLPRAGPGPPGNHRGAGGRRCPRPPAGSRQPSRQQAPGSAERLRRSAAVLLPDGVPQGRLAAPPVLAGGCRLLDAGREEALLEPGQLPHRPRRPPGVRPAGLAGRPRGGFPGAARSRGGALLQSGGGTESGTMDAALDPPFTQGVRDPGPVVVGVTGASGVVYARRLVEVLLDGGQEVFLVASSSGRRLIREELPGGADPDTVFRFAGRAPRVFSEKDFGAPFCSGSFRFRGMAIVPASMGTIGAIASGVSFHSIHRGADVTLKERRPLVVVPRETPLSTIHLENL